jgi:phosphonate transport system substrate-binding protein
MKRKILLLVLCALCIFTECSLAVAEVQQKPLVMGVFPRRNARATLKLFKPVAEYLSQKLGREVQLVTDKNFEDFWNGVAVQKFDIVHYNQYHYLLSHKKFGYEVILKNEEFGRSTLAAAIVVRKDSGIESLRDLKGKRIAFGGGRQAMISYIVPKYLLLQAGLKNNDYEEVFANNPPNAVLSTFYKQSDAAGAGNVVLNLGMVKQNIDVNDLKYLVVSKELAHIPWAVKKDMDSALRNKIKSLLLDLRKSKRGRQILQNAQLTGFVEASDAEYDDDREIVKAVYGETF